MALETPRASRPLSATHQSHRRVLGVLRPRGKSVTAVSTWATVAAVLQPNPHAQTHLQTVESAQIAQADWAGLDSHHPLLNRHTLHRLSVDILKQSHLDSTKTRHALPAPRRNPKGQFSHQSSKAVHRHLGSGIRRAIKGRRVHISVIAVGHQTQKVGDSVTILPFDRQRKEKRMAQKVQRDDEWC